MIPASNIILTNELAYENDNLDLSEFCGKHLAACQAHGDTKCPLYYQQGTRERIIRVIYYYTDRSHPLFLNINMLLLAGIY